MILSQKQRAKIFEFLPERTQELIDKDDVNELLGVLHDLTVSLFDEKDDPTPQSDKVEALMDEIYWDNTHY